MRRNKITPDYILLNQGLLFILSIFLTAKAMIYLQKI